MIPKLTEEQRQAMRQHPGKPIPVEDEHQQQTVYLVTEDLLPDPPVDRKALKQAILADREESRRLNAEWEHVGQEVWEQSSDE